jgi:molybdopterin synthase sulfur carrier subunit
MARVLLFGPLRDLAGWREREVAGASIAALRAQIAADDPELGLALAGPGVQVALDQALVRGDRAVGAASEVAFLPPMSGG